MGSAYELTAIVLRVWLVGLIIVSIISLSDFVVRRPHGFHQAGGAAKGDHRDRRGAVDEDPRQRPDAEPEAALLGGGEAVQKWDGKLPVNMYGSSAIPFIDLGK